MSKEAEAVFWLKKLEQCITTDGNIVSETPFFRIHKASILPDGSKQFPYVEYSDEMFDFWEWLECQGYAEPFQYVQWMDGFFQRCDPERNMSWLEMADKDTLNKFLFCLRRRERFHEALWAKRLCNGYILKLFRRVLELENIF